MAGYRSYYRTASEPHLGDDMPAIALPTMTAPARDLRSALPSAKTAGGLACTYHGYKRTGSLAWALLYGLCGHFAPYVTTTVAVAQGFGEKRGM